MMAIIFLYKTFLLKQDFEVVDSLDRFLCSFAINLDQTLSFDMCLESKLIEYKFSVLKKVLQTYEI